MILNASSADSRTKDLAPSVFLLEVMNRSSLAESRSKSSAIMKRQGARVNLPLGFVKSMVSDYWCNYDSDIPGKLSMFFIDPCDHLDDEKNLNQSLKLAEGKGLSDKSINQFLK